MTGNISRRGIAHHKVSLQPPRDASAAPPVKAGDPEYERSQVITREDRRAMLRSHFAASGMSDAEIEAHMGEAKF